LGCIKGSFRRSAFCPQCSESPMAIPCFAFFDGYISFSSVFCCS
jgi:hypothetical protein